MVVLTVLKWIGIVLGWLILGILALLLLILLLVLFVPIRYRVKLRTGEEERFAYGFQVTWILHAISVKKKPEEAATVIRILGIPIKKIGGEEAEHKGDTEFDEEPFDEDFDEEESGRPEDPPILPPDEVTGENTDTGPDEGGPPEEPTEALPDAEKTEEDSEEATSEEVKEALPDADKTAAEAATDDGKTSTDADKESSDEPDGKAKKSLSEKLREKKESLKQKIRDTFKKLGFIFYQISSIMDLVKDRSVRNTVKRLLKEVVRLIRYVGPKKITGTLRFGTGDPASTGMILAGVSCVRTAYRKGVSITPDFEEKCLVGDCELRGRIRGVYFVRMALRIWFDKEVHRLWKRYRRMNKQIKNRKKELQL